MVLKSVGVLSVGKVFALLQGAFGLIAGAIFALVGMLGAAAGLSEGPEGIAAVLFGGAAIIILPILYALIGFIGASSRRCSTTPWLRSAAVSSSSWNDRARARYETMRHVFIF